MTATLELMEQVIEGLEDVGPEGTASILASIVEAGIPDDYGLGNKNSRGDETAKWWLGQVRQIIESQGWFAMNSILNWGIDKLPQLQLEELTLEVVAEKVNPRS